MSTYSSSLTKVIKEICTELCPSEKHHEHIWPRSNGEGTAGFAYHVDTDAEDEDNAAATTQDYWGEPTTFNPSEAAEWHFMGLYIEAKVANKTFQWHLLTCNPSASSAKNAGNAWDKNATALTVADGSIFAAGDKVAIFSDYKVEIQDVDSVATNVVTVSRETNTAANTGLRWDHTTNEAGSEVMYLVGRANVPTNHPMGGLYSASSTKDHERLSFHAARAVEGNGFVLIRALNQTDGTNDGGFYAAIIYED